MALLSKSTIAFHSPMARKPKGQKKSCVAAPLQVVSKILGKKVILPVGAIGGAGQLFVLHELVSSNLPLHSFPPF